MVDHADDTDAPAPEGQASPAAADARWDPRDADAVPAAGENGGGERVAKALARAGVASRREVERYIAAGRVALNGRVLDTPAVKVGPADVLTVDGEVVGGPEPTRLFRYHKPAGLITTNSDPQGRPTVFDHLPDWLPRVLAVGRLDLNTEGLLLLTNDGALSRALELPASGWVRRYRARAYGRIDQARLDALKEGVTIEGVRYGPIEARLDKASGHDRTTGAANVWISVAITEGKNREVRRVLDHLGLKVNRLIRLAYGPFALSTLPEGEVEEVGPRVIREQLAAFVAPENLPSGDHAAAPPPAPRADAARRPSPATRPKPPPPAAAQRGRPPDHVARRLADPSQKPSRLRAAQADRGPHAGRGAPPAADAPQAGRVRPGRDPERAGPAKPSTPQGRGPAPSTAASGARPGGTGRKPQEATGGAPPARKSGGGKGWDKKGGGSGKGGGGGGKASSAGPRAGKAPPRSGLELAPPRRAGPRRPRPSGPRRP